MNLPTGDDRFQHTYIVGGTGMGKSSLMQSMIYQDIQDGAGVAVIDPHSTLAQAALSYIPKWRDKDLIYLNVADRQRPLQFNPLSDIGKRHDLMADNITSSFKHVYGEHAIGPRSEMVLTNAVLAILDTAQPSLLHVLEFLMDKKYRKDVLWKVEDPFIKRFWTWFEGRSERYKEDATGPIINKLNGFLTSSAIRNIITQQSTFNFEEMMDGARSIVLEDGKVHERRTNQQIFIANLSKAEIGEQNSYLLGALAVSKLFHCSFTRATQRPFYIYIDEFQNFATDGIDLFFSEARKMKVALTVGHQYIGQLPERLRHSVFGNVATVICFKVGAEDSPILTRQLGLNREDILTSQSKHHVWMLEASGEVHPHDTEKPPEGWDTSGIVEYARRFGKDREKVEYQIKTFIEERSRTAKKHE